MDTLSSGSRFVFINFCYPAKVYFIIALISLLYYVFADQDMIWIVVKALLFILWGFFLNKLCRSGLTAIAWLLAIIPQFVFLFFTVKTSPAIGRSPNSASGSDGG